MVPRLMAPDVRAVVFIKVLRFIGSDLNVLAGASDVYEA